MDDGRAFDPTAIAPPPTVDSLEDATIGGHGMQLMRHYLDDVQYAHEAGHNRLTLIAAMPRGG
ncbi:Serine/threonine-protein kinase BtrW [Mycobacteroides abscessus subsp. abscessus]|nr:Serine/threonine-protein kinase BtrW [Mycobacteroides abscessus subsp. abscessus]